MKLFFSLILLLVFSSKVFSEDFEKTYIVKTKGIAIGVLEWTMVLTPNFYEVSLKLKNKGLFSSFYNFEGNYNTAGKINNGILEPTKYTQSWVTKKKKRYVKIVFKNLNILELNIIPEEKEKSRIQYSNLVGYNDPLTSFVNILIKNTSSLTIDGRRTYMLKPKKIENYTKISIEQYLNIWADHNRKDLKYLEVFNNKLEILPTKINIKYKGLTFSLIEN